MPWSTSSWRTRANPRTPQRRAFAPTFSSSRYKRSWILTYLGPFYDKQQVADVLRKVKGGKEANVYCCAGGPALRPGAGGRQGLPAAPVSQPAQRFALPPGPRGPGRARPAAARPPRAARGAKGHAAGQGNAAHLVAGARVRLRCRRCTRPGVRVPQPLAFANNTILMEYFGELTTPAPALRSVKLKPGEARTLFDALLADVATMLACGRVHADLSAFNVLYWRGDYRIIDFPQSVDPAVHPPRTRCSSAMWRGCAATSRTTTSSWTPLRWPRISGRSMA